MKKYLAAGAATAIAAGAFAIPALAATKSVQVKGSFSKKLTKAGTYTILCTIHAPGMKMTIKVK